MLAKRRYQRRVARAGDQLFHRLAATPSSVSWYARLVPSYAAYVIKEWPIELFDGARYNLVSDASTADAVDALSWWMIASIEKMANGGDSTAAATAADATLTLRDAVSLDFEAVEDIDEIGFAITDLLIGRDPLIHESVHLIGPNYLIAHALANAAEHAGVSGQKQAD